MASLYVFRRLGENGGGAFPYISYIDMSGGIRVGFLSRFGRKLGYGLKCGYWFLDGGMCHMAYGVCKCFTLIKASINFSVRS